MNLNSLLLSCALTLPFAACAQQPAASPSAADIMARVAANQDRSEAERLHFLYLQHAHVTSRKGKTIRCEETTDSRVTPTPDGSQQELLKLDGRLLLKGKYIAYTQLPTPGNPDPKDATGDDEDLHISIGGDDNTTDRDLVENMRRNLTNTKSKDGLGANLFPLTTKSQADDQFELAGREPMNGRDTFHIRFHPKDKSEFGWKGDAWIDATAYEPVVVRTAMSRNVPFAVRTLLGTSLPGLGFTVLYAPQTGGVWFPISFGTEFKLRILFFFSRQIIISAENRSFEKTHVTSKIVGGGQPVGPPIEP